jgi:hypothetical protein
MISRVEVHLNPSNHILESISNFSPSFLNKILIYHASFVHVKIQSKQRT